MKWINVLVALLAAGILAWLLWRLCRLREALRREREENHRLREIFQVGSQAAQTDLKRLRRLRHDLRQYLILAEDASSVSAETDAALREALETAPSVSGGEGWMISVLERHYLEQARDLGFQADLRIIPPQAWEGATPDLCLVLSNLLENGLEALQREGGGWLRARSVSTAGYFSLVIGNSCTRPLKVYQGHYLSSKAPGRFGIGLETVREVAQRYGGQAEFTAENGEFRASVYLPRQDTTLSEKAAPVENPILASPQS